jgi:AmmeMemoRadiSam system protein B
VRRKAAVAGYFYPQREKELREMISKMVLPGREKKKSICVVSPHAGFIYSGPVAGAVFSSVDLPSRYVILGPSHRGIRSRLAMMREGTWESPFGDVSVDTQLADLIMNHSDLIEEDSTAHLHEHSLEVQLPFIQYFRKDIAIVPICISFEAAYQELEELGRAIALGIKDSHEDVLIVASTDMSHYVEQEVARKKDFLAIERILDLDAKGLYDTVTQENISMCGFQPVASAVFASKELGARKAELVKYQTSGDVTGDFHQVVGYAGIRIH